MTEVGPYHIEKNPLICKVKPWTGFYMIETSVMKEFNLSGIDDVIRRI